MDLLPYLAVAFTTYIVGTASPGPATLAIMATAMESGRTAGLALALGVISGSLFWGSVTAFGLGSLIQSHAVALVVLKIAGGAYLLWLAWRSARASLADAPLASSAAPTGAPGLRRHYLRGLGIHLTNPKAVFIWTAIIALGLPAGAPPALAWLVVAGCACLGVIVFIGYALVFSSPPIARAYTRLRRWISAGVAVVFGAAGLRLITS